MKNTQVDNSDCLQQCSGLHVSSYERQNIYDSNEKSAKDIKREIKKLSEAYWKFKGYYNFPLKYKGTF